MKAKRIYWTVCADVFVVGMLAVTTTPRLDYTFDLTNSLLGTLYVIHKGGEVEKGELITYRQHDGATYPADTAFIKRVVGVADDTVKRAGSAFWVNDQYIDTAKSFLEAGASPQPAQEGVTGAGEYLVSTPNPNSLDSRYALVGNTKQAEVTGRTYEIL